MLTFNQPTFEETNHKEWIISNGIGGYASSTIIGTNTRRYHGLLVASLNPPTQRQLMVSKIEESISLQENTSVGLSSNSYQGTTHPTGYQYVKKFERSPFPRVVFQIDNHKVAKTIFMVYGSNTTVVEYENIGDVACQLSLTPLFADRDYHSLFHENPSFDYYYTKQNDHLKIFSHYGAKPLFLKYSKGNFTEARHWFKNFEYEKELYRGLDFHEDAYCLGSISLLLEPGEKTYLVFTLNEQMLTKHPERLKDNELKRIKALSLPDSDNQFFNDLLIAGDQFLVRRTSTDSYSVLAGYHWFTDWGRDTMIAMRGLCIAVGRKEISRSILQTFLSYLSQGMLPNRFPDNQGDEQEYNTVDATLWMFVALYEYYQKFGDSDFIRENFDKLIDIIHWHVKGTRYNIHLTDQGFLFAGEGNAQLTWMDARVGEYVVTPRHGCPVEIQALWYNALKIYLFFIEELNLSHEDSLFEFFKELSEKLKSNFTTYFMNQEGYLNDVITPGEFADVSIRPNQIYALSLPFSLLSKTNEKSVFRKVQQELFTPYGLRTLNKDHSEFKPFYMGDQWQRDTAYHQGTVWPFLLGDYFHVQLKLFGNQKKHLKEMLNSLETLRKHFYEEDCIHGISEIFDGAEPGQGRGTIHQAWSIAALLKVMIEANLVRSNLSVKKQMQFTS